MTEVFKNHEGNMKIALFIVAAALSGCAAKSVIRPVVNGPKIEAARHNEPVCMMKSPMPSSIEHTVIGKIHSSKKTYGSVSELLPLMAEEARTAGADAVINLSTGQKMGLIAWSRPVGTGTAIKLADRSSFNCVANGGELR